LRRNKKELRVQKPSHVHAKHGYTPIQYTLWAEMIGASTNNSEDELPTLFQCSPAKQKQRKSDSDMGAVVISVLQLKSASTYTTI